MGRIRMTDQSLVNVKAATTAQLLPVEGDYKVKLKGESGKSVYVRTGDNLSAVYPSKAAAKKALQRHNPLLLNAVALRPEI